MQVKIIFFIILMFPFLYGMGQEKISKNSVKKAQKSYYLGDYEKAVEQFKTILTKDAGYYVANYELGRIYLEYYNHYDSASVYLKNAIDNAPKDTIYETYLDYANCLHRSNNYTEAILYYNEFKEKGLSKNSFAEILRGNVDMRLTSVTKKLNYVKESGNAEWSKSLHKIDEGEKNTSIDFQ